MARTLLSVARRRAAALVATVVLIGASSASAETLLMPERDYLMGLSEVVWGVTTLANGTAFVLDYGDATPQTVGTIGAGNERSYIAYNHTFPTAGTFTVRLCVGAGAVIPGCPGELASVQVRVYDGPTLTPENLRGLNVNRAIENGLRYLWVNQVNREVGFPGSNTTYFAGSYPRTMAALVVLAFENHGYHLPNNNSAPTGVYEKYIVQRGLNFIADQLTQQSLNVQLNVNPCVGAGIEAAPCIGLQGALDSSQPGYSTAIASLPFAGSNALARQVPAGLGSQNAGYVAGKTYGEILQRILNAVAHNQTDQGTSRGGWSYYNSNNGFDASDGSVIGWDVLAILDGGAAGAAIPPAVITEFRDQVLPRHVNNDGSFDYTADSNPAASDFVGKNHAKVGIGLQSFFMVGEVGDVNARVLNGKNFLNTSWNVAPPNAGYACQNGTYNKGCGYGMFNVFKGLKLHGITTLTNVNRPAGSVGDLDDWYADYVDWLLLNQSSPTTTAGGQWDALWFSSIIGQTVGSAALAELILSPVALIAPDPTRFSLVGLRQGSPLSVNPDTNPVKTPHTVVAKAESQGGAAIPGVTICFDILDGSRNAAVALACGTSDANGEVSRTYTDAGPANAGGTDQIQAWIGQVGSDTESNILVKNWILPSTKCDANSDGVVNQADLVIIRNANGQVASGPTDPRDGNSDGAINVADVRYCQLRQGPVNP